MGSAEKDAILARAKLKPVIVGHCEVTNIKSFLKLFSIKVAVYTCIFYLFVLFMVLPRDSHEVIQSLTSTSLQSHNIQIISSVHTK